MEFDPTTDDRIVPVSESGCWIWTGSSNENDYGRVYYKRKTWAAHRAAYDACVGKIPDGMIVCHACDVSSCVNPDHLFVGTLSDNMKDMVRKGRRPCTKGVRHGQAKLTDKQVAFIFMSKDRGRDLAARFGVAESQISFIRNGRTWRHVTENLTQ